MIRVMRFDPTQGVAVGEEELLAAPADLGDGWIWVDLTAVDPARERQVMEQLFGLPRLAVQDAQRDRHPPKLEVFDDCVFLLLRELPNDVLEAEDVVFHHVAIFVGASFVLTRRVHPSQALDDAWSGSRAAELARGPSRTLYRICRRLVDHYTPMIIDLERRLGDLEDEMFAHPSDAILESLATYNRILKRLRRTLTYQRGVMAQLARGDEGLLTMFDEHEFNDAYENMERLASLCQLNQELAVDLLNTYLSLSSHRLNQIMRVLTIVTVMFLPLGLLAGIYGMNFQYIPELGFRYGYFVVVGVMITVVVTLAVVFKLKKWL